MISVVREMCIFMIIAQAVMFFIPGSVYVKYVRVLVGIMMIVGITGPLFGLFINEEKKMEISRKVAELEENIHMEGYELPAGDGGREIYDAVETELKERLGECESNYRVLDTDILENKVVVTVEEKRDGERKNTEESPQIISIAPVTLGETEDEKEKKDSGDIEKLKELYGQHIGVSAENIEIVLQ